MFRRPLQFTALAAALLLATPAAAMEPPPKVGQPAPDFRATTMDGKHIQLADFKGQVLILNFWATWCGPCRNELPVLDSFARMDRDAGLRIVAVDFNDPDAPNWKLAALQAKAALQVARRFDGVYRPPGGVLPTSFIIDRTGVVRAIHQGSMDADDMNTIVTPLLKAPSPDAAPTAISFETR